MIRFKDENIVNEWNGIVTHLSEKLEREGTLDHDYIMNMIDEFIDKLNLPEDFTDRIMIGSYQHVYFENGYYRQGSKPSIENFAFTANYGHYIELHMYEGKIIDYVNRNEYTNKKHVIIFKNKEPQEIKIMDLRIQRINTEIMHKKMIDGELFDMIKDKKYYNTYEGAREISNHKGKKSTKFDQVLDIMSSRINFKDPEGKKTKLAAKRFGIPEENVNRIFNSEISNPTYNKIRNYYEDKKDETAKHFEASKYKINEVIDNPVYPLSREDAAIIDYFYNA